MNRLDLFNSVRLLTATALLATCTIALAQDKVSLATNWRAQASQGGFFQAVADGTYAKYGLDVTIQQGGPQVNNRPLLAAGRVDFLMTGGLLTALENTRSKVPTTVVAAFFQKDPTALIAHKGQYRNFAELKSAKTVFIAKSNQFGFWQWLKAEHGFNDEQFRPYTFNLGPFMTNKTSVQQAYATAEVLYAADLGAETDVFLLDDHGYNTYGNLIEARNDVIKNNPDLVQRFVDASIIGWNNFLFGDPKPGLDLIKKLNPDLSDAKLEAERAQVIKLNLVTAGEGATRGIGAINKERVRDFANRMIKAGIYKPGEVNADLAVTDQFVNKKVGLSPSAK